MMMVGTTTTGTTTTGTTDPVAAAPRAGKMATMSQAPSTSRWSRILPSAARTRIIAWVLLLVMAALGIVTLATWLLLKSSINARMDEALRVEVEEFGELSAPGVNPRTGEPFASIDEVIHEAIAYNIARPNEKFLGYVDGVYRTQSRQEPGATEVLAQDEVFGRRVATVTEPTAGRYEHPSAGEVRYLAIPVSLDGDDSRGVIVAAYLGDAEREAADNAARMLLLVGSVTMVGAAAGAWLLAGRVLHPLRDVVATAHTITDTDMSQRIPMRRGGERDEINELVATLNGMLDRIEAGIAVQRRFIDDVGHELRTPITIVRGHLEVLDPTDAEDIAATVALVDDELTRMNRMVSDLLVPRALRAAVVPATGAHRRRRAHRGRLHQGLPAGRAQLRPGNHRERDGGLGSAAHHPGPGCVGRQRDSVHRTRRTNRGGVTVVRRLAAILGLRLRARGQPGGSGPHL